MEAYPNLKQSFSTEDAFASQGTFVDVSIWVVKTLGRVTGF